MITAIIQLALVVFRWWKDPDRMKRELIKATEAAHEKAVAAFASKVGAKDEDGVNADIDDLVNRSRRMLDDDE